MDNPFEKFNTWYEKEKQRTTVRIPSACCLSTIGTDGYPNARFVSLKRVHRETFIITGPINSQKGREITAIPKASLTFWWPESERQIRIQGNTSIFNNEESNSYFSARSQESKIVSSLFQQGQTVESLEEIELKYAQGKKDYNHNDIAKPSEWKAFAIEPIRIEFMEFKKTRLHLRTLYQFKEDGWQKSFLQP